VPAALKTKRRNALMADQKRIVARVQKSRLGCRVRVMVDGPSLEHELVWRGRIAGQAPDIDPVVYLTDADPGNLRPGDLLEVEIIGASDYDLMARPM
jgi:ribosomal protein S12 methylthiotransferase